MKLKKYLVKNMNEALNKIKYDLGQDAVIISQRKVKKPGIKGFFTSKILEVTVAVDDEKEKKKVVNRVKKREQPLLTSLKPHIKNNDINLKEEQYAKSIDAVKALLESASEKSVQEVEKKPKLEELKDDKSIQTKTLEDFTASLQSYNRVLSENQKINLKNKPEYTEVLKAEEKLMKEKKEENSSTIEVISEVKEMKAMLNDLISKETSLSKKEEKEDSITKLLIENDVDLQYINGYKEKLQDTEEEEKREKLKETLSEDIGIFKKTEAKAVVLVGPTGVGKTTTIAKLAGRYSLVEGKKVGLITIDTYRIGAVEQLKTYSEIMNIPFKVVFTIKDMETAIKELSYCDIILIDTTGRSSKNMMQISELRAFIDKVVTENIYLVLSSTTKNRDLKSIIEGYKQLKYNSLIVTKLDETTTYGSLLNVSKLSKKPIGYITTGQGVPDDIKIPSKDEIIKLILGEEKIC